MSITMNYNDKIVNVNIKQIEEIDPKHTAPFQKPKICGCFSLDKDRKYIPDATNMMYYFPRFKELGDGRLKLNLNIGLDKVVRKPPDLDEKLDHLLQFILLNKHNLNFADNRLLDTDFICYRGLLTQIMCCIHLRETWTICATKWKGNIYLCETDKKNNFNIPESKQNKFCSWGYKFEQYMMTNKLGVAPDTSKPVYESEEFCCVYKSKLGTHKIIYGAELDGVLSSKEINCSNPDWDNIQFVELKTSKNVERTLKRFKFIKWWAQSFLVNVKEVHCGFRDDYGFVREIVPYFVKDLPKMSNNLWDWKTCLNFCNTFLNIVKDVIPENTDDPYSVWKFIWKPEYNNIEFEVVNGCSPYCFLPKWYIENMSKRM